MTTTMSRNSALIIDPPVDGMSSPGEIRAWINRLEKMIPEFVDGSQGAKTIAREIESAQELLTFVEGQSQVDG